MNTVSQNPTSSPAVLPDCAYPWTPDCGDGTYRNPILCADYSDPDVIRHGEDFWMTASSFNCTPGLPILHSRDLVNWTLVGHALRNVPDPRYAEVQPGCGVWAPTIRFHAGKFWIFFSTPDEGIYVVTAPDPRGPWSQPHLVQAGKGLIDPSPLWDDDGRAYLVHAYAGSRAGIKHMLRVRPMAPDGSALLGEGRIVFHAPERHPTIEGPKFLKRDGWYYILAPAGGVATGWQVALRSRDIYGPYEDKIILERGSTAINGPHQGALVDADGDWWFAHFQDAGVYGRIVHLQPAKWKDGWPLVGVDHDGNGIGEPVLHHPSPIGDRTGPIAVPQTSDEFNGSLGLQWQWHANHREDWASLNARPGWLRLSAQQVCGGTLLQAPNLFLQKWPAGTFAVETSMQFHPAHNGDEAGLVVAGRTCAALVIRRTGAGNQLIYRVDETDQVLLPACGDAAVLRATVSAGGIVTFRFSVDGRQFVPVPGSFTATPGVWIGAKIGLYCLRRGEIPGGHADFNYFRFTPSR